MCAEQASSSNSLGMIVSCSSPPEENGEISPKENLYRLQDHAADLLPGEGVCRCNRSMVPMADGVVINQSVETGRAYYSNLQTCKSVWMCPVCARRITDERRRELSVAVAQAKKMGLHVSMITVTLRHSLADRLADLVAALRSAYGWCFSGRWFQDLKQEYGWRGTVSALEATRGIEHGWHPHLHVLLFTDYEIDGPILAGFEAVLKERWQQSIERFGFSADYAHGLHVKNAQSQIADYIAKYGREPEKKGWSPEHEIAKAPAKTANRDGQTPFGLLRAYAAGDKQAGALFREYALTMKGRRQMNWSKGLWDLLDMDAALAAVAAAETAEDQGAVPVAVIDQDEWRLVCAVNLRGDLLSAAENDGLDGVLDLLDRHRIRRKLPNKLEELLRASADGPPPDQSNVNQAVLPFFEAVAAPVVY